MKKLLYGSVAAIVAATVAAFPASSLPITSPNQVSDFAVETNTTSCAGPAIGYNAITGETLVAWSTDGALPQESVEFALLSEDGSVKSLNSYTHADAAIPMFDECSPVGVSGAPNGGFLIVWDDDSVLTGLIVDSAGEAVGSHFVVSSNSDYYNIETLDVEWSAEHNKFLVAWKTNLSAAFTTELNLQQLVGRFLNPAGVGLGDDFLITNDVDGYDNSMDVSYGNSVWGVVGNEDGAYPTVTFVSGTGSLSEPFSCQASPESMGGASIAYNAAVNGFLCVWKSGSTVEGNILFTDGTLASVTDLTLSDSTVSGKPRAQSLGVSGWILTWHGASSKEVFGSTVDVEGTPTSDIEFVSAGVDDSAVELNFRPAVTFSPASGHAYIAWVRNDNVANESEVYARAWYVREGEGLPDSELADTGVDASLVALVAMGLIGVGAVVLRRRRA